jgi:hypothetical protein
MLPTSKQQPKSTSLYRELPAARRLALVTHLVSTHKDSRAMFIQRLVQRGGGFRAATLLSWPPAKLAAEVVRLNAQNPQDELDLLQALYVDVEPAIQIAFLKATGVKSDGASIDESLEAPFADAAAVKRGAEAVLKEFGEDGRHYLRTIAKYNGAAWPGIESLIEVA